MQNQNKKDSLSESEKDFYKRCKLLAAGPILLFSCVALIKFVNVLFLDDPIWPLTEHPKLFWGYLAISFVWFVVFKAKMRRSENQVLMKNPYVGTLILLLSLAMYVAIYYILHGLHFAGTIVLFPILITYSVSNFHTGSKQWFKLLAYTICLLVGVAWVYVNEFGYPVDFEEWQTNIAGLKNLRFNLMTGAVFSTFLSLCIRPTLSLLNRSTEKAFSLIGTLTSYVAILLSYAIKAIQVLVSILKEDEVDQTEEDKTADVQDDQDKQIAELMDEDSHKVE